MSKSLKYVEASGLDMTLEIFKVKRMQEEPLTKEELIVEAFLQERLEKLKEEIKE